MNPTETLAELATTHPGAASVFYRHGLDFCCGGRRTLAEACGARGLDPATVLADVERETEVADRARRWDLEPMPALVDHLVTVYHQRLRDSLPDLVRMAAKVEMKHAEKPGCPHGLAHHLVSMGESLFEHLDKEEQVLFPMILRGHGQLAVGPVHVMEIEHDEHARNLQELRRLTGDMQPPDHACPTWRALYLGLQQLDRELMEHIHLENNVLFRRALVA